MILSVLCSSLLFSLVGAQTCSTPGDGPCMNGVCPMGGHTCTTEEICCADPEVILPLPAHLIKPVPAPGPEIIAPIVQPAPQPVQPAVVAPAPVPAPAPSGCVDNVKVTCSKYKKYCNVKEYNFLLTKHCPLTCNLCPGGAASSSAENQEPAPLTATGECVDKANPRNGKSNCASMVQFCTHERYKPIMEIQCRKTCGLC